MLVEYESLGLRIGVYRCQKGFKIAHEIKFQGMLFIVVFEFQFAVVRVGVLNHLWRMLHAVGDVGAKDLL